MIAIEDPPVSAEPKHLINTADEPTIYWSELRGIKSHKNIGTIEWDPRKIKLLRHPAQGTDKKMKGTDLLKKFKSQPLLNATVFDFLMRNEHLIPKEWLVDVPEEISDSYGHAARQRSLDNSPDAVGVGLSVTFLGTVFYDIYGTPTCYEIHLSHTYGWYGGLTGLDCLNKRPLHRVVAAWDETMGGTTS